VAEGLEGRWALVARRASAAGDVVVVGTAGDGAWQRGQRVSLDAMPCRACIEAPDRIVVIERDVATLHPGVVTRGEGPVESFHGVAIADRHGQWIGVLSVLGARPRADSDVDRALLRTVAQRLAQEFERGDREHRLREREQYLELAMEVSDVTVTVWDVDADAIEVRGNWLERFELERAADGRLRMTDWLAAIHPDDRQAVSAIAAVLRSSDAPTDRIDYRMRAHDGGWRWVRGRAQVVARAEAGAPRLVVSVQSDIHDLIAKEQELRASESQLRLALDAGELSIADWSLASDELRVSDWWLRGLGYADGEIGPRRADLEALTHPDDVPAIEDWMLARLRGEAASAPVEFRLRRRDGGWRWTRAQGRITARDAAGRATRMTGVFANIDAARRAAEQLRERSELLELAVRGTADGLWDWTPHDGCFYLSPRGHELLNRRDDGMRCPLAEFVEQVLPAAQRERLDAELARVRAGRDYIDFDLQMRTGGGALRWFRIRGVAVRDPDGGVRRMVGSMSDVHEARAREQELARARQLTSEAIESLDAGLVRLDADDRIVLINTRYLDMYDLPRDRAYVGMPLRDVFELYYGQHPASRAGRSVAAAVDERMRMHREHKGSWALELGGRWFLVSDTPTADGGRVCLRTDITDLKSLQQALKARTDYLELVVRGSSDGLWSWDMEQGDDLYLSPRVYDLLGYEPGEIPTGLDAFMREIYHPEDRKRIRTAMGRMIAHPEEGDILSLELRLRCRNGEYRWFHNRAAMARRADGSPLRIAGSISDVHERRLREQELTIARQQLSDAIEAIDSGLMISDREDRLVLCNRRYREMYEFPEELVRPGTNIAELARDLMRRHPEYRNGRPIEEAIAERIAKHRAKLGRWELQLGEHWYQIGDYATGEGGVVSLRTEITHLKRVEQELRERTEFLEAAVRGSMDGIYDVDLAADSVWFAPRFHELLGHADGELPTVWSAFTAAHMHPDEAQARLDALARSAPGEAEFVSREMRLKRKDGRWGWYHGRAAIVRDAQGKPYRLIGSLSDTNERHRREEELAQARQQLQDAI
ncbi:MAG: PAS domain-containing protein, partial [Gammaproteobacteria bacterium]